MPPNYMAGLLRGARVGAATGNASPWGRPEQVGDGVYSVYFGPVHLGWLDERDFRIMDVKEQSRRRR